MLKKLTSTLLAAALCVGCALPAAAEEAGYQNFRTTAAYADGVFSDVSAGDWYRDSVAAVYELGLMVGAEGAFDPGGPLRLSEAVTLAARLHSTYAGAGADGFAPAAPDAPWYQPYADYCLEHGILAQPLAEDAPATRAGFVAILAHALPAEALPAVNDVPDGDIPDVKPGDARAEEIYQLYRAGILAGINAYGSFAPEGGITRAEAAAVLSRMAYRSLRQKFTLAPLAYPDPPEMPSAPDAIFASSAMLGNSLAQGMMLYSNLHGVMGNYAYQSTTVLDPNFSENCLDRLLQRSFERVYIEFGLNEIYMDNDAFTAAYGGIIDRIRAAMPGVEIYVMSLTPVTRATSNEGSFTMERIRARNAVLREMCVEKECWFLDVCDPLCGADGYLDPAYIGWNGTHLNTAGYLRWEQVIRTYYV